MAKSKEKKKHSIKISYENKGIFDKHAILATSTKHISEEEMQEVAKDFLRLNYLY